MKLVKMNIAFKCPMEDCMVGEYTNGAECLRCVLIHIMGDQQTWEEVHANRRRGEGDEEVIDISMNELPDVTPELTEKDLQFLSGNGKILMGQKEWGGEALEKAVELYSGSSTQFQRPARVIVMEPEPAQLTDSEHEPEEEGP